MSRVSLTMRRCIMVGGLKQPAPTRMIFLAWADMTSQSHALALNHHLPLGKLELGNLPFHINL